jgi:hypothetical protein
MIMGTSIGHGTLLERTPKFQPKRVSVSVHRSIINHGSDEECLKLAAGRKKAKLQWLQDKELE